MRILDQLGAWLDRVLSPGRLTATVQAMTDSQHDESNHHATKAARETLARCATRLDRYRAALDSRTDPIVVGRWVAEVQAGNGPGHSAAPGGISTSRRLTFEPTARVMSAQVTPSGSCTRLCPRIDTN